MKPPSAFSQPLSRHRLPSRKWMALRIDHIGSTSVPGLAAKDVIDMQVIVANLDRDAIVAALSEAQFIHKYAEWNLRDHIPAGWVGDVEE
jgi:GrpB-like predicted nucleotidyltransferase (UPF0157 family)